MDGHFTDDLLGGRPFDDIVKNYDFEQNPRFELSKLSQENKLLVLDSLPDYIPEGRIEYISNFLGDLDNYIPGSERLFQCI